MGDSGAEESTKSVNLSLQVLARQTKGDALISQQRTVRERELREGQVLILSSNACLFESIEHSFLPVGVILADIVPGDGVQERVAF